jgi:AraC-like DNA-binding protein
MHMPLDKLILDLRSYSVDSDNHQHDYHQLVLPVSGQLDISVGKQAGQVNIDQAAIINAGKEHGFAASQENCFVVADIPNVLAPEFEQLPAFIHLSPALNQYVRFLHQQLLQHNSGTTQRQMLLLLIQLLQEQYGIKPGLDRRISVARNYLDNHFDTDISNSQLAFIANLSTRHLTELFRKQLGMTPHQYLIEKRMQQAWQLLEQGSLSVQQVADAVGYSNLAAFSDRFRKHFAIPPSYFRRFGK